MTGSDKPAPVADPTRSKDGAGHAAEATAPAMVEDAYASSSSPRKNPASNPEAIALIAIYESGNGAAWASNDGWNLTLGPTVSPCEWKHNDSCSAQGCIGDSLYPYGVTCSSGRVEALEFETVNHDGMISGTIPTEIGLLSNLRTLMVSTYRTQSPLHGTLPTELSMLTNLRQLRVPGSLLSGTMPSGVYTSLTSLRMLSCGGTRVSGSLATQIGNINLDALSITAGRFSGTIPTQVGHMRLRTGFDFSYIPLSGTIPTELAPNLNRPPLRYPGSRGRSRTPSLASRIWTPLNCGGTR